MGIVFEDLAGSSGADPETTPGAGYITIPLSMFATEQTVPAGGGLGVIRLPSITVRGVQGNELAPSVGSALIEIPLSFLFSTSANDFGSGDIEIPLPELLGFGADTTAAAGEGYSVVNVPVPTVIGLDALPVITNYGLAVQDPGVAFGYGAVAFHIMEDTVRMADATTASITMMLVDRILMASSVPSTLTSAPIQMVDVLALSDALHVVVSEIMTDGVTLSDSQSTLRTALIELRDRLLLSGVVTTQLQALDTIADVVSLVSTLANMTVELLGDGVAFNDAVSSALEAYGPLIDSVVFSDTADLTVTLLAVLRDGVVLSDSATSQATLTALLSDSLVFNVRLRIDGATWIGHVMNAQLKAYSTYTGLPFNSMAELNGVTYATGDGGLYRVGANNDAGTAISATLRDGLRNFGTNRFKRMPTMYIGAASDGRLVLKVTTVADSGEQVQHWYQATTRNTPTMRENRTKIGKGLRSVYWSWELVNPNGEDFSIDTVDLYPIVLEGRF